MECKNVCAIFTVQEPATTCAIKSSVTGIGVIVLAAVIMGAKVG